MNEAKQLFYYLNASGRIILTRTTDRMDTYRQEIRQQYLFEVRSFWAGAATVVIIAAFVAYRLLA